MFLGINKKGLDFLFGATLLHFLILLSVYHGEVPSISGIVWKSGEMLSYPFAVSRFWDLFLFPSIFLFWCLFKTTGFWKSDFWDKNEQSYEDWDEGFFFGHLVPLFVGGGIAGSFLGDCGCSTTPWFNTLSVLIIATVIAGITLWTIVVAFSNFVVALYVASLVFFFVGIVVAFGVGFPYFLLISVPTVLFSLLIVVLHLPKGKEFLLNLKQKWEARDETKRIIQTALNLKVSPKTKEKVLSVVKELPVLQKEIKVLSERISEINTELGAVISQLVIAEASAMKKDVDEYAAAACKAVTESLLKQKETIEALLAEYLLILQEKEQKLKQFLELLAHAKQEADFCKEYDFLAKTSLDTQKRVKSLLEKISGDLSL